MIKNPKQEGSNMLDCKPQVGLCKLNCNQCFYNRPGAFYIDVNKSFGPTIKEAKGKIVRINCGHDSNIEKELVSSATRKYTEKFYNTSIPNFVFPAPVVFTANRLEETGYSKPQKEVPDNLMFIRIRVSSTNLEIIDSAVKEWTDAKVPVVLTFMAYYTEEPKNPENYVYKIRNINPYWCVTNDFIRSVLKREKAIGGRLVTICGILDSDKSKCKDCRNCETYYWQTLKHMKENNNEKK